MTPLDERAQSVLDVARSAHQPNTADAARVRNALASRLRAEPLLIETPGATAPLEVRAIAGKWLVALAIGGAAGFAAGFVTARALGPVGSVSASSAAPDAEAVTAPVVLDTPQPAAPRAPEAPPPALESAPAAPPRPLPSTPRTRSGAEPRSSSSPLQAELDGLRRAQELLHRGQAAWAIARLDELDRAHVGSVLGEERLATRAIAECSLGRDRSAQLDEFARRFPRSAHLEQVRASCSADTVPDSTRKSSPPQTESSVSPHQ